MRLQLLQLAAAFAILGFAGSQAQAVDIYVLSGSNGAYGNTTTGFGKIDSATGAYTEISAAVSGSNLVGNLAWNAAQSSFYVTEDVFSSQNLRTLSVLGTLSAPIGTIGTDIYGMAYRPVGSTLYAYNYNVDDTDTINPTNGGLSLLNPSTGLNVTAPNGGRYTMLNDTIYASVFQFTGSVGKFGTFGYTSGSAFSQIGSNDDLYKTMVLASDGTSLYGVFGDGTAGNQKFYSINPTTGVLSFMTNVTGSGLGNYFFGAAADATAVPEPSTYALAAIATGVMAYVGRRRKARQA